MITPYWNSLDTKNFDEVYRILCRALLVGEKVGNTRELRNIEFSISDINDVYSSTRNPSKSYMLAELLWYLNGSRDTTWISRFAPYWSKISDNGITANSAYGYLIKYRYEFDQLNQVIKLLKHYPNSRRAVINLNWANPMVLKTKDEPCTIALQFYIREEKLHCTAMMRSNDIWTGLPYDIVYFTLLQKLVADALDKEYGSYTHFATSLHLYEKDECKIRAILAPDHEVNKFHIDHKKLCENAKYLFQVATKDNIVRISKQKGVLIDED